MNDEIWKAIPGYEGLYEASDRGRIKSLPKTIYGGNGAVRHHDERILSAGTNSRGYKMVVLFKYTKRSTRNVHRLVVRSHLGDKKGLVVNHLDGVKTNNVLSNLEWTTSSSNQRHAYRTGLRERQAGEKNGRAILTRNCVALIKKRLMNKEPMAKIATDYKVSRSAVQYIKSERTWKDVETAL